MSKRKEEERKQELDSLVIDALMPVFPPSELRLRDEVAALAHCVVMETPGWSNITSNEIRSSLGRIYWKWVAEPGKANQPVHWDVRDVLRFLRPYKEKYPELLKYISW